MDKKGFEFSFGWMFAILVGGVMIFLAVYAASRFVGVEREVRDTELGKEFGILLSPLEAGIADAEINKISLPGESRIFTECSEIGNFGSEKISLSTKSSIGGEWSSKGRESVFYNKYIFAKGVMETRELIVFSKPFNFPYKVADLLYLIGNESYCFVNAPERMKNEIIFFNSRKINATDSIGNCEKGSLRVCFGIIGCDVDINLNEKRVSKKGQRDVYYDDSFGDALLYGAIFSDSLKYECQVKRLMKRAGELSLVYGAKTDYLSSKGCSSGMESELALLSKESANIRGSIGLKSLASIARELKRKNELLNCKLF